MVAFRRMAFGLGTGLAMMGTAALEAQQSNNLTPIYRPYYYYGYSPQTAYSAGVLAEAEFVRAEGEFLVNYSIANRNWVDAYDKALDNAMKELKYRIEARIIGEAERYRRDPPLLERQIKRNANLWTRFKNYPELSGISISNGTALNFLLDRLSTTVLAYQLSQGGGEDRVDPAKLELLTLTPEMVAKVRFKQRIDSGLSTFGADKGESLDLSHWPATLRGNTIRNERTQFLEARTQLMASENEESLNRNLETVSEAYEAMLKTFTEQNDASRRNASLEDHKEFTEASRFLQKLRLEIYRLRRVGMKGLVSDSLKFEGDSLIAMLTHMSRNGLIFDKPNPGDESVYHQIFAMMRDLYLVVAPDEEPARKN